MASLLKDIEGYEGLYKVSSSGDVFSMPRPGSRSKEPYKMVGGTDQFGYRLVGLTKNGRNKTFRVHRLVANAFMPNPHGYSEINHKDENKENNDVSNLEWCERAYNVHFGERTKKTQKGVVQLSLDGELIAIHEGLGAAAKALGKPNGSSCISRCCKGERKTALGYKWRWTE